MRILMNKAGVSDAFRSIRVDPDNSNISAIYGRRPCGDQFPADDRVVTVPGVLGGYGLGR